MIKDYHAVFKVVIQRKHESEIDGIPVSRINKGFVGRIAPFITGVNALY